MDLSVITEIANFFEQEIGYEIPPKTPFVGRNFNMTRAGIHADGLLKDQEIYNIFDTEKILGRPAAVSVDSHSGLAGIAFWINGYFRLNGDERMDKRHPLIAKIKEEVDKEYAEGRNTAMGDDELDNILRALDYEEYERLCHIHLKKRS
jgi:isopropylmalate/homocitrate/citramalate synthase